MICIYCIINIWTVNVELTLKLECLLKVSFERFGQAEARELRLQDNFWILDDLLDVGPLTSILHLKTRRNIQMWSIKLFDWPKLIIHHLKIMHKNYDKRKITLEMWVNFMDISVLNKKKKKESNKTKNKDNTIYKHTQIKSNGMGQVLTYSSSFHIQLKK